MNKKITCVTDDSLPENIDIQVWQLMVLQQAQSYEELYALYLSQDKNLKVFTVGADSDIEQAQVYMNFVEMILGQTVVEQLKQDAEKYKKLPKNCGLLQSAEEGKK